MRIEDELINQARIIEALITPQNAKYSDYMITLLHTAAKKIISLRSRISDTEWERDTTRWGA